jgi:hypothetical protein
MGIGSGGHIPVAVKDFWMEFFLKEDTQALQKRGKKSPFLTDNSP